MNADPWPEDTMKRSYFTNGLCGEGTDNTVPKSGAAVTDTGVRPYQHRR